MWQARSISSQRTVLDFSSSGQGPFPTARLVVDGEVLVNAIDLVDWTEAAVQIHVCDKCGTTQCEPGGWVSLRRVGPSVLLMPAFSAMADNAQEFRPPELIAQRGPLLLSEHDCSAFRAFMSDFPRPSSVPALTGKEAAQLIQFSAPGRVLGAFPAEPTLRPACVLASEPHSLTDSVSRLNRLLAEHFVSSDAVVPHLLGAASLTSLHLDLPGTPSWQPLTASEPPLLVIGPGIGTSAA